MFNHSKDELSWPKIPVTESFVKNIRTQNNQGKNLCEEYNETKTNQQVKIKISQFNGKRNFSVSGWKN